jgi:hypothetical protein
MLLLAASGVVPPGYVVHAQSALRPSDVSHHIDPELSKKIKKVKKYSVYFYLNKSKHYIRHFQTQKPRLVPLKSYGL